MLFSKTTVLAGILGAWSCTALPAEQQEVRDADRHKLLPPSCCSTKYGVTATPSCYTATVNTTPTSCPRYNCPIITAPLVCPQLIVVTTTEVPCKTDCCPHTPTVYSTSTCEGCRTTCAIPTSTLTVTTGCPPVSATATAL